MSKQEVLSGARLKVWRRFARHYRRRWKRDPRYDERALDHSLALYAWQVDFLLDEIDAAFEGEDSPESLTDFVRRIARQEVA